MKKIIALACALVMLVSMFTVCANAAVDGATVTLEFAGYEVVGPTTFANINVNVTIPDVLSAYESIEPDWINSFDYSYSGTVLQGLSVDIPYIDGLQFIAQRSTVPDALSAAGFAVSANATSNCAQVVYAKTDANYAGYYAGDLGTVATLCYRITGDVEETYTLAVSNTVVGIGTANNAGGLDLQEYRYKNGDFTATSAVIEPEEEEFVPETIKGAAVEGDDADITLEKDPATAYQNTYTNVALFEATLGADVNYSEAGFIWVKDEVETTNKFKVDASVIAGGGTFQYGVVMYAIPDGVDIDAIPYYVTAE